MNYAIPLFLNFFAGGLLAVFYFWGLWLTVQRLTDVKKPYLFMLASHAVRLGALMTGLYLLMAGHWEQLIYALAGFLAMRTLLLRRWTEGKTFLN
jgi:F1F0 ATPase subunit 2